MTNWFNPFSWFNRKPENLKEKKNGPPNNGGESVTAISPGRVSVPDDDLGNVIVTLRESTRLISPSFRSDLIPLIRDLYKVNPDVSIAVQDMFKLANTGHVVNFPKNTGKEAEQMRDHLIKASKNWGMFTGGINGIVNKFIVQALIGGAISIEAVPNKDLTGLSTILFIKPESIYFHRDSEGKYHPYQKNNQHLLSNKPEFVRLNSETYVYASIYNDLDEPYGIPPFLAALDSIKGQHDMRVNFKNIMEIMGMVGFLEAKIEKPMRKPNESEPSYEKRLTHLLRQLKINLSDGMKDGIVTGFIDDHEFKLNSTTENLSSLDKPWNMNQQSVANGLGVNSSIIGVQSTTTEGGAGIQLSKMISQLKNIQMVVSHVLEFVYTLELRLAGFNNKGIEVSFGTSTVSDEVKVQQGLEYKIRNLTSLFNQGIISQEDFAFAMGYRTPYRKEPLIQIVQPDGVSSPDDHAKKQKREDDKDKSDRKVRDKNNPNPKRKDQDSKPR